MLINCFTRLLFVGFHFLPHGGRELPIFHISCSGSVSIIVSVQVGKEKMLPVKVVKIHPLEKVDEEASEKKSDGACDSPSSDKENSSQAAQDNQKEAVLKEDENRRESLSK